MQPKVKFANGTEKFGSTSELEVHVTPWNPKDSLHGITEGTFK